MKIIYSKRMRRDNTAYKRKWIKHYGAIPKDEHGRSLEIHHIDGDHTNNNLENLILVTIEEHYELHYKNEDWGACIAIAMRMKISPEEKSKLLSLENKKRIDENRHNFQGRSMNDYLESSGIRAEVSEKVREHVRQGVHNFQSETHRLNNATIQSKIQKEKFDHGTHPLFSKESKEKSVTETKKFHKKQKELGLGIYGEDNPQKRRVCCMKCRKETSPSGLTSFHKHEDLLEELKRYQDWSQPLTWVQG